MFNFSSIEVVILSILAMIASASFFIGALALVTAYYLWRRNRVS